jgi:hypothetical protein
MHNSLHGHVARELVADSLRDASERRRSTALVADATKADAHARQRALVRASLLLSRREDVPTARRWA